MRLIDADALKLKKRYSEEDHEYVVPVAAIDWAETMEPEKKRGKWNKTTLAGQHWYKCSECTAGYSRTMFDFCPYCGADMCINWDEDDD